MKATGCSEPVRAAPWSAEGTAELQGWVADLADAGVFDDGAAPGGIVDWRLAADRILATLAPSRNAAPPAAHVSDRSDR